MTDNLIVFLNKSCCK